MHIRDSSNASVPSVSPPPDDPCVLVDPCAPDDPCALVELDAPDFSTLLGSSPPTLASSPLFFLSSNFFSFCEPVKTDFENSH